MDERDSAVPKNEKHSFLSWLRFIADVSLINYTVMLEKRWKLDGRAGNALSAICVKVFPALAYLPDTYELIKLTIKFSEAFAPV